MPFRKLILRIFFPTIFLALSIAANANDSLFIRRTLKRIELLQAKNGDKHFPAGVFPAFREYHHNKGILKNDDNSFYTGLIAFTLRKLRPYMDGESKAVCDSIINNAMPAFEKFKNPKGRATYNFYQTQPPVLFPNSGWLNLLNESKSLPDDLDVTSILLLAMDAPRTIAAEVHDTMQNYVNGVHNNVRNTFSDYQDDPAYSTWFGVKMPVDFDICVLANILYMVHKYDLPYTKSDSASLNLVCEMIKNRHHINKSTYISPYYDRTSVILYHLSRLMEVDSIPQLERYRDQLISDAKNCYANSSNLLDKIILSTALIRWKQEPPVEQVDIETDFYSYIENNEFVFFIGNIACILPNPYNEWVVKTAIGKFYYYCPAYNLTLVLENYILGKYKLNS
jgi:hypothetical protein